MAGGVPLTQWVVEWFMGDPTLVVLGDFNKRNDMRIWTKQMEPKACSSEWTRAFPDAIVMAYSGRHLPDDCAADFTDCVHRVHGSPHTCLPGPINRYAEAMVAKSLTKLTHNARNAAHKKGKRRADPTADIPIATGMQEQWYQKHS